MKLITELINNVFRINKTDEINPQSAGFQQVNTSKNKEDRHSMVDKFYKELDKSERAKFNPGGYLDTATSESEPLSTILTNKQLKLTTFRVMAESDIISDAVDEIKYSSLNMDENGNCININIRSEITGLDEIKDEFKTFIEIFDFNKNLTEYVGQLLIDGELCWENIINANDYSDGIIGVKPIKTEAYEFAFDINSLKREGITILNNSSDVSEAVIQQNINAFKGSKRDLTQLSTYVDNDNISDRAVFLPFEQLTYCNTGNYTPDGLSVIPLLNKTKKPYNQLTLIEDAILIYRLVRAPERLAFNIDAGNMQPAKAEQLAAKLIRKYNTKQIYDKKTGTVNSNYDAISMMDNYWFVATNGGQGTKVETVGGTGQSLMELDDLDYWVKKVYKTLKVPFSRYSEPTTAYENADVISYEEYRFYKFIMSGLLIKISEGVKSSFITHIKMKNMWVDGLSSRDINVEFIAPSSFDLYQSQKLIQAKLDVYTALKDIYALEDMNTYLLKKSFGLTDKDIDEIYQSIEKDKIRQAEIAYKVASIEDAGTLDSNNEDEDFD